MGDYDLGSNRECPGNWIIASHFSTRMHPDQIQRIVEKRFHESLRKLPKVWL